MSVCCALLALAALAIAPGLPGWEPLDFDGRAQNTFEGTSEGVLVVESRGGASMLFHRLPQGGSASDALAWRWRVESTMAATDLTRKGADDRPLALYLSFPYDPATATLAERMTRPLVELRQGRDAPGRVLAYTWGGTEPRGAVLESPYLGSSGAIVVLRSGDAPTGVWFDEEVDPQDDYRRVFGAAPAGPPLQIAVGADSDDTAGESLAYVADIRFGKEEPR